MQAQPILLVEDDVLDAELTQVELERFRLDNPVIRVPDGAAALDYLQHRGSYAYTAPGDPAFMLLDLHLPKMDGLELLAAMRADEALSGIPVIVLSGSRRESDLDRCRELGVQQFVSKPVDFRELLASLAELGLRLTIHREPTQDHEGLRAVGSDPQTRRTLPTSAGI